MWNPKVGNDAVFSRSRQDVVVQVIVSAKTVMSDFERGGVESITPCEALRQRDLSERQVDREKTRLRTHISPISTTTTACQLPLYH
jgi:hypothetical protein